MQISREQSANNMIMQNLIKDVRPKILSYEKRHNIIKKIPKKTYVTIYIHLIMKKKNLINTENEGGKSTSKT